MDVAAIMGMILANGNKSFKQRIGSSAFQKLSQAELVALRKDEVGAKRMFAGERAECQYRYCPPDTRAEQHTADLNPASPQSIEAIDDCLIDLGQNLES